RSTASPVFWSLMRAPTRASPLSRHAALPISTAGRSATDRSSGRPPTSRREQRRLQHQDLSRNQLLDAAEEIFGAKGFHDTTLKRSEEHTSELQSREKLVCRLLLEQKKKGCAG